MLLHIINLFYNFVVYNLIVCNLIGNILRCCYSYSVMNAQGLHLYCMQFNCIQSFSGASGKSQGKCIEGAFREGTGRIQGGAN